MRPTPNLHVERYRVRTGRLATSRADGNNGAFLIPYKRPGDPHVVTLSIIVSDGMGWDHVSVHATEEDAVHTQRTPSWAEMDFVKNLFWREDETVMQLHPAREDWVNNHEYTLHMWRPQHEAIPLPPKVFV